MVCCCKGNLSQAQDKNANKTQVMTYIYRGTFMVNVKASIFELLDETWGTAYGLVSFGELAME